MAKIVFNFEMGKQTPLRVTFIFISNFNITFYIYFNKKNTVNILRFLLYKCKGLILKYGFIYIFLSIFQVRRFFERRRSAFR